MEKFSNTEAQLKKALFIKKAYIQNLNGNLVSLTFCSREYIFRTPINGGSYEMTAFCQSFSLTFSDFFNDGRW